MGSAETSAHRVVQPFQAHEHAVDNPSLYTEARIVSDRVITLPSGLPIAYSSRKPEENFARKRPLMIAGLDVVTQQTEGAVAAFCHRFRVPLITTYKAKGVLPEDDPLALGAAGLSPRADRRLLPLVAASDCIFLAGYDPVEMRAGWRDPWPDGARAIDLPAVLEHHGMHRPSLKFPGHVGAGLEALGQGVAPRETWPLKEPAAARTALRAESRLDEDWGPAAVVDVLRRSLPRDAVVTTNSGARRIVLSQLYECYQPRGLLQSSALCTMGCAVPLAIGRKLAEPERTVVATVGDAGLEMFLGELATVRDLESRHPHRRLRRHAARPDRAEAAHLATSRSRRRIRSH